MQMSGIRPEDTVILCSARTSIDSERADMLKSILKQNIDWQYLMKTAQQHGLMPLLYKNLNDVTPEMVPEAVMKTLQQHYNANRQRNLFLTAELIKLLQLFEENGIPAIPFKGPSLTASVYGDLALRQFCDLDILVQKQDVLKIRDLLMPIGFTPLLQLTGEQVTDHLKYQYEFSFKNKNGKVTVGLHWEIVPQYLNCPIVSRYLWQSSKIEVSGSGFSMIPPEYLLLMLCVHGTKHNWTHLMWVCDVSELIRVNKELDWDFVLRFSGQLGCKRMLLLGLFLAKSLLGTSFPDMVLQKIEADPTVKRLGEQVQQRLFNGYDKVPILGDYLFYLMTKERLRDKARYLIRITTMTSPDDRALLPLPHTMFFVYHFIRPLRLMVKYFLKILRRKT